eukprot:CAMPEP_0172919858 /NCGR_PEP_ID=MMETSP1075-20121228/202935_1 /TAXON_ID=2916 /ORGANISM="Ceratium fusus, Strain PA161109" /LENGTH=53 /DNA_ID=CAMNT_0013779773 /DNA_START=51 /DNA_END=208 /DNA_ORIENTATION=-
MSTDTESVVWKILVDEGKQVAEGQVLVRVEEIKPVDKVEQTMSQESEVVNLLV